MQDVGIDLHEVQHTRSWRWLRVRIEALVTRPAVEGFSSVQPANRVQALIQSRRPPMPDTETA